MTAFLTQQHQVEKIWYLALKALALGRDFTEFVISSEAMASIGIGRDPWDLSQHRNAGLYTCVKRALTVAAQPQSPGTHLRCQSGAFWNFDVYSTRTWAVAESNAVSVRIDSALAFNNDNASANANGASAVRQTVSNMYRIGDHRDVTSKVGFQTPWKDD